MDRDRDFINPPADAVSYVTGDMFRARLETAIIQAVTFGLISLPSIPVDYLHGIPAFVAAGGSPRWSSTAARFCSDSLRAAMARRPTLGRRHGVDRLRVALVRPCGLHQPSCGTALLQRCSELPQQRRRRSGRYARYQLANDHPGRGERPCHRDAGPHRRESGFQL